MARKLNKDQIFKAADKYIRDGKVEKAITEYERWLTANPKDWNTIRQIGDLYHRIGRNADAIKKYSQIAEYYKTDGFNVRAIATYKMILRLEPQNEGAMASLAELQVAQGLLMEAKAQYQTLVELYTKSGQKKRAAEVFKKLAEIDPSDLKVRYKYAEFLDRQGQTGEAIAEYVGIADEFINNGLVPEAIQIMEKGLRIDSANRSLRCKLAQASVLQGDYAKAIQILSEIQGRHPDDIELLTRLGEAYMGAGSAEEAETVFGRLAELEPNNVEHVTRRAEVAIGQGHFDRALELLNPVVDRFVESGDGDKAATLLQKVLGRDPHHVKTLVKLSETHTILKKEQARISSYDQLCEAYSHHGDYEKAVSVAAQLIELEPENSQHKDRLRFLKSRLTPQEVEEPAPPAPEMEVEIPGLDAVGAGEEFAGEGAGVGAPEFVVEGDVQVGSGAPIGDDVEMVTTFSEEDEEHIKEKLTEAEVFVRYGLVDKAIDQLKDVLESFRFHVESREKLIEVYKDQGMNREAAEQIVALAKVFEHRGENDSAERLRAEARELNPALADTPEAETVDAEEELELTLTPEDDLDELSLETDFVAEAVAPTHQEAPSPELEALEPESLEFEEEISAPEPVAFEPEPLELEEEISASEPVAFEPEPLGLEDEIAAPEPAALEPESLTFEEEISAPALDALAPETPAFEEDVVAVEEGAFEPEAFEVENDLPTAVQVEVPSGAEVVPSGTEGVFSETEDVSSEVDVSSGIDEGIVSEEEVELTFGEPQDLSVEVELDEGTGGIADAAGVSGDEIGVSEDISDIAVDEEIPVVEEEELAEVADLAFDNESLGILEEAPAEAGVDDANGIDLSTPDFPVEEQEFLTDDAPSESEELHVAFEEEVEAFPIEEQAEDIPVEIPELVSEAPEPVESPVAEMQIPESAPPIESIPEIPVAAETPAETAGAAVSMELQEVDEYIALGLYEDAQDTLRELLKRSPGDSAVLGKIEELGFSVSQLQMAATDSIPDQEIAEASIPTKPSVEIPPSVELPEDFGMPLQEEPLASIEHFGEPELVEPVDQQVSETGPEPFVDFASELSQEMFGTQSAVEGEAATEEPVEALSDPGLDEIFREFKKGVEKQLGTEDYDTRYNLGIAYKEMGLLDEAIAEFQLAAKDDARLLECCSMLGLCFMEKGMPEIAIKWFEKGLGALDRSEEEYQGLRYDLAQAHESAGNVEQALGLYMDIYHVNARFRDVKERVRELQAAKN